jgi:hypothetical protein
MFNFMSPINLAIVSLRLLAVYCFVTAVPLFSAFGLVAAMFAPRSFGQIQSPDIFTALLPGGSLLILAVLLFVFSQPLARRIASTTSPEPVGSVCTFEQCQSIAFAAAGVLILAAALPSVGRAVQDLFVLYAYHKQGGTNPADRFFSSWLYSAGVIAQLAVGLALILKPKGFRNVWRYLRTAGT